MEEMTTAQMRILRVLDSRKVMTPQQVAVIINSTPGPVTRSLDALERQGLAVATWSARHGSRYRASSKGAEAVT